MHIIRLLGLYTELPWKNCRHQKPRCRSRSDEVAYCSCQLFSAGAGYIVTDFHGTGFGKGGKNDRRRSWSRSFKIEQKVPYAADYNTCIEQAKNDLRAKARPELVSVPESLDSYDEIYLGYPKL